VLPTYTPVPNSACTFLVPLLRYPFFSSFPKPRLFLVCFFHLFLTWYDESLAISSPPVFFSITVTPALQRLKEGPSGNDCRFIPNCFFCSPPSLEIYSSPTLAPPLLPVPGSGILLVFLPQAPALRVAVPGCFPKNTGSFCNLHIHFVSLRLLTFHATNPPEAVPGSLILCRLSFSSRGPWAQLVQMFLR